MKSMHGRINNYAFKLNGKKIERMELERTRSNLNQNLSRYLGPNLDRDMLQLMAFDEVINKELTLKIADDLHVKVPSSDVNAQYKAFEKSIGNKEQFKKMLQVQGFTKKTFKDEIKDNMLVQKAFEKIAQGINPSEDEIVRYYHENEFTKYNGQTLEEAKEDAKNSIVKLKTMEQYYALLEKAKSEAKVEDVADEYKKFEPKVDLEKDGYKVTNVEIARKAMSAMANSVDKDTAEAQAKEYYERQIGFISNAKADGIALNGNLPIDYQIVEYQQGMYNKIRASLKPTEAELKDFFKDNSLRYDTYPSAKADIAILKVEPSDADKKEAKVKAENLLKELTPENFAEKAKEFSNGPSAPNGGQLGWFAKGDMVAPFDKAIFEGKVGEIYPQPVETQFGYHLIYIEDRHDKDGKAKASHILIIPKISDKTVADKKASLKEFEEKLAKGEISFEDAGKNRPDIIQSGVFDINNAGYISGLGYNDKLADAILKAPLNKLEVYNTKGSHIYIFKKIDEVKFKRAKFEEIKERVTEDYKNVKAQEAMSRYM